MNTWWRRIALSLVAVLAIVLVYAGIYQWGMATFEGEQQSYVHAIQVVIESLTTAGYGGDAPWESREMNVFIVTMNLSGVLLVFLALPLIVVPLFRQALEDRPPETTDLSDHIIICSHTPRVDVLRKELEAAEVPYVFVDDDPETVIDLVDDGLEAIVGDPELEETLRAANVEDARALVADVDDETNAAVILSTKQLRDDIEILSVVEDADVASYHRYAGADVVVRPRQVLGRSLAKKAAMSITAELEETIELGTELMITELLIEEDSDLAGNTIAESGIRDRIGVTVIGAWFNGEFVPAPGPEMRIDENTILLVAGRHDNLTELKARTVSPLAERPDRVVVGGYGVVGRNARDTLVNSDISCTVVDTTEGPGVDVVGSITDEKLLETAGVEDSRAVLLALDDDTTTIFATLVLKQLSPDVEVIARANETENIGKLYQAGAEYVLALSTVTGRMISSVLLEDEEVLTPETQFEIVRTTAPDIAGRTLGEADVRSRTGCTVVAVERGEQLLTDVGPEFAVQEDDTLIVAGSDETVNQFIAFVR
ncbi:metal transporter [Natronococcus pandeyae]|uniref:Metal transporter n=1 Tax=Natronococcus pandeyae TaxID=2055836 RepID=A0A8J8TR58_9EURY|nr:potassium channel protein [Natronococcus pandeyae]TYL37615.1 metal transporter [Natronococcus pandeyae]